MRNTKLTVIIGYVLVMGVMTLGLVSLYKNLVDYSNKKINNQDLSELLIVSNTLSLLYEIESEQNLITAESAEEYFQKYDSIVPVINNNLGDLKAATTDSSRVTKLDSITILVDMKKENLQEMAVLLDSLRRSPRIIQHTESSYVPRELNREIADYLESRDLNTPSVSQSDTSVVVGERRRFLDRVRDVFDGRADSTLVIESRSVVADNEFKLIVDTLINKVRYSERLDLERQRQFQQAFFERQELISHTNRMLTARIDELLKEIEQEEIAKSVQLLVDKEEALTRSEDTMHIVSIVALVIALVFGLLFLIDINRSQRYRKQLESSNKRISELLQAREQLMLTISHDIKAPMSSIMGYLELMESRVDENIINRNYLTNMQQSGEHVLELISTLLDYHKLESGTWQMKMKNSNLKSLVDDTVQSFKPLAHNRGLEYKVINELPETKEFHVDPYVLRQVMSNLISNAIKYSWEGEVSVVAREETIDNVPYFQFRVTDTGIGIAKEDQQDIFKDFKQVDNSLFRIEGTGLGLAITQRFVNEMKGTISLESVLNEGSEFTVMIPLEAEVAPAPSSNSEGFMNQDTSPEIVNSKSDFRVLVVDDDPVQLQMMAEMLKIAGVNGTTEERPERVLNRLKEQPYDLVFVDLQMPNTDGQMLVKEIRDSEIAGGSDMPIIALSARSDITEEELKKVGFSGFLTKPFTFNQLNNVIQQYTHEASIEDVGESGLLKPLVGDGSFSSSIEDRMGLSPNRKREQDGSFSSSIEDTSGSGSPKGVEALIHVVKEDKEASLGILKSFSEETSRHIILLKEAFSDHDDKKAKEVAHTLLPLVKMMGDNSATTHLEKLENKVQPDDHQRDALISYLEEKVDEANRWIHDLEKDKNDKESTG